MNMCLKNRDCLICPLRTMGNKNLHMTQSLLRVIYTNYESLEILEHKKIERILTSDITFSIFGRNLRNRIRIQMVIGN